MSFTSKFDKRNAFPFCLQTSYRTFGSDSLAWTTVGCVALCDSALLGVCKRCRLTSCNVMRRWISVSLTHWTCRFHQFLFYLFPIVSRRNSTLACEWRKWRILLRFAREHTQRINSWSFSENSAPTAAIHMRDSQNTMAARDFCKFIWHTNCEQNSNLFCLCLCVCVVPYLTREHIWLDGTARPVYLQNQSYYFLFFISRMHPPNTVDARISRGEKEKSYWIFMFYRLGFHSHCVASKEQRSRKCSQADERTHTHMWTPSTFALTLRWIHPPDGDGDRPR